jgi:ubiquinone/menaquinone biosynthesis C-methylase UbiE
MRLVDTSRLTARRSRMGRWRNAPLKRFLRIGEIARDEPAEPHFVSEYTRHVRNLMASHPLDEAMSLAVGGRYDEIGKWEVNLLKACGLGEGMSVIDLGCGSGRLAKHLGLSFNDIRYVGIDVVQELLDYAASKSPPHFRFVRHHQLSIPAPDSSADFVIAMSVFTHLFHEESYIYLEDMKRVLRPGASVVFSFLESRYGWPTFETMLRNRKAGTKTHLNMFMERPQIEEWCKHLGIELKGFDLSEHRHGRGQTVAVLVKA